jgi:hypothetical protein
MPRHPDDDEDPKSPIERNEEFIRRMSRAIKMGRERVRAGTFVDTTPFAGRRITGDPIFSAYGSPSAMCAENGLPDGGASSLK